MMSKLKAHGMTAFSRQAVAPPPARQPLEEISAAAVAANNHLLTSTQILSPGQAAKLPRFE
jgi:hypothetical protein